MGGADASAPAPLSPAQWAEWDRLTDEATTEVDRFYHVRQVSAAELRNLKEIVRRLKALFSADNHDSTPPEAPVSHRRGERE